VNFKRIERGYIRAYSPAQDTVEIRQEGRAWTLTVLETETGVAMHTFKASRAYLCCQEACRFFGVGAYRTENI
jgi:hypothetical protein